MEILFKGYEQYLPLLLLVIAFIGGYQMGLSSAAKENYQHSLHMREVAGEKFDEASSVLRRVKEHEAELFAKQTEVLKKKYKEEMSKNAEA